MKLWWAIYSQGHHQLTVRASYDNSEDRRQRGRTGNKGLSFPVPHCLQSRGSRRDLVRWHNYHTAIQLAFYALNTFSSKHATQQGKGAPASDCLLMTTEGLVPNIEVWLPDALHLPGSEMVRSQCSKWVACDHISQGSKIYCFDFCLFANWFYTDDSALINRRLKRRDQRTPGRKIRKYCSRRKKKFDSDCCITSLLRICVRESVKNNARIPHTFF